MNGKTADICSKLQDLIYDALAKEEELSEQVNAALTLAREESDPATRAKIKRVADRLEYMYCHIGNTVTRIDTELKDAVSMSIMPEGVSIISGVVDGAPVCVTGLEAEGVMAQINELCKRQGLPRRVREQVFGRPHDEEVPSVPPIDRPDNSHRDADGNGL